VIKPNNKIVVIVGPTASGKSDLAKHLIKKFNGEAISADSRQIYRHMDIGTGKDKTFTQHMIDIREPFEDYSVAEYQKEVYQLIDEIINHEKVPFIVGGTGLYINAVIYGYQFPKTNLKLRTKIEKLGTNELYNRLKKYDPISAEKNKDNHRRLVRAMESYLYNRRPLSKYRKKKPDLEYLMLGIDIPRKELYERIDKRVDARIKEGMIEEVKKLLETGISHNRLQRFGLEYRYISEFLQKANSQKPMTNSSTIKFEMIQKLKYKIHAFARRQFTWFRKNREIIWIKSESDAVKPIRKFLQNRSF